MKKVQGRKKIDEKEDGTIDRVVWVEFSTFTYQAIKPSVVATCWNPWTSTEKVTLDRFQPPIYTLIVPT